MSEQNPTTTTAVAAKPKAPNKRKSAAAPAAIPPVEPETITAAPAIPADDEVAVALAEVGITDPKIVAAVRSIGINTAADFAFADKEDFLKLGILPVAANKLIRSAGSPTVSSAPVAPPQPFFGVNPGATQLERPSLLPTVREYSTSWLGKLRASGNVKFTPSLVLPVCRALAVERCGIDYFGIPKKIVAAMEAFADEYAESVPDEFYELEDKVLERDYSEIARIFKGYRATRHASPKRRKKVLEILNNHVWPSLNDYFKRLEDWYQRYDAARNNVSRLLGGRSGVLPSTNDLEDYNATVVDAFNKVFAGVGKATSATIALEAEQIDGALSIPNLHQMIGAPSFEHMITRLGIEVAPTLNRYVEGLAQFALAIVKACDIPAGQSKYDYYEDLYMLSVDIKPFLDGGGRGESRVGSSSNPTSLTGDHIDL